MFEGMKFGRARPWEVVSRPIAQPGGSSLSFADLSAIVDGFDPEKRSVAVGVGFNPDGPNISSHDEGAQVGGAVEALSFDGLNLWAKMRGLIDPESGKDRMDEAIQQGFARASIGIFRDPETGIPTLDHIAQLSLLEQPAVPGMPPWRGDTTSLAALETIENFALVDFGAYNVQEPSSETEVPDMPDVKIELDDLPSPVAEEEEEETLDPVAEEEEEDEEEEDESAEAAASPEVVPASADLAAMRSEMQQLTRQVSALRQDNARQATAGAVEQFVRTTGNLSRSGIRPSKIHRLAAVFGIDPDGKGAKPGSVEQFNQAAALLEPETLDAIPATFSVGEDVKIRSADFAAGDIKADPRRVADAYQNLFGN